MKVSPVRNPISFKYKCILKSEWLKGNMPEVTRDMEGNVLTASNCTLGHMKAHSKGGKTRINNLMLETKGYNISKSSMPFSKYFDRDKFLEYCKQFEKIDLPNFNGLDYIASITKNAKNLLRNGE